MPKKAFAGVRARRLEAKRLRSEREQKPTAPAPAKKQTQAPPSAPFSDAGPRRIRVGKGTVGVPSEWVVLWHQNGETVYAVEPVTHEVHVLIYRGGNVMEIELSKAMHKALYERLRPEIIDTEVLRTHVEKSWPSSP